MIRNGTTRHMAIKQGWEDNKFFHFRHLQFEISPRLSSWNSSNYRNWGRGIIYWMRLLRTNISLPLESQKVLELYEADPAVWNGTAGAKGNATEHYSQHPSNGSIKETKVSQGELQELMFRCWQKLASKYCTAFSCDTFTTQMFSCTLLKHNVNCKY